MKLSCSNILCISQKSDHKIFRHGQFYRPSDRRIITRFKCSNCSKTFSQATFDPAFGQNKRRINYHVKNLLSSGNSQRRIAKLLKVNRKTIARKVIYLGQQAQLEFELFLKKYCQIKKITSFQFDDLQTIEHTKCKPLSVCIAIEKETRKILGLEVSSMPATGHLAKIAREKYGYRSDERQNGLDSLFKRLEQIVDNNSEIVSDSHPYYLPKVKKYFPSSSYKQVIGGRGCIAGQGELKKKAFDPMFTLNHTFAMLRDNIKRLTRKTWCTTKNPARLKDILLIYTNYHNKILTV